MTDDEIKADIMKRFEYGHLPKKLQEVSRPICELAKEMDAALPNGLQKWVGLWKLLEAKDCFVRALVPLLLLVMLLVGCSPNAAFIRAERASFNAIAPEYLRYVMDDESLSTADRDIRRANLLLWDVGIREEERNAKIPLSEPFDIGPLADPEPAPDGAAAGIKHLAGRTGPSER